MYGIEDEVLLQAGDRCLYSTDNGGRAMVIGEGVAIA